MAVTISMAYGTRKIPFNCKGKPDVYAVKDPVCGVDPERFAKRLHRFMAGADLDLSAPAVVVADKTRLCGYPQYLPVLLDALIGQGADPGHIVIYIAYGTHLPQSEAQSQTSYGPVFGQYRWVHHQCQGDHFVHLGNTRRGTPVRMRADILDASCVITFGAISHHYFAGYGGGRKLLFPGLGEKRAIYANHGLFLDARQGGLASGCQSGRMAGNPLAEDLAEVEAFRPADLSIHGILDSHGKVCDLLVGQGEDHFQTACTRHAAHCEVTPSQTYDLVVAACGGFPKDINFIQSHKAIHHAAAFVRDGGQLVVLAQCRDGIGSETFLPWFQMGGRQAAFDALADAYVGNGGTALAMMAKLKRIRIGLVTQLDPGLADAIGVEVLTLDHVQACLDNLKGSVALIPNAAMLVLKPVQG
jgi:lactate racemase